MEHLFDIFGTGNRSADNHERYGAGFVTQQDDFAIAFDPDTLVNNVNALLAPDMTEKEIRSQFSLCTTNQWSYARARAELPLVNIRSAVRRCLYRPFDYRYTVLNRNICTIQRTRIMDQFAHPNLALLTTRRITRLPFNNIFAADIPPEYKVVSHDRNTIVFPLYHYPDNANPNLLDESGRQANLSQAFCTKFAALLNMVFVADGGGDRVETFGPDDVLAYIYAVFHSDEYRQRYGEMLTLDFPRVPLTQQPALFRALCSLGDQLLALHLMRETTSPLPAYPVEGDNRVGTTRYTAATEDGTPGRIWINRTQYFEGVPESVWQYEIGGYPVASKWIRFRRGRTLDYNDLVHYQRLLAALSSTINLTKQIDVAITDAGGWPLG